MGGGPDGSGSVGRGFVSLPLRSHSQHTGGGAGRSGSVEALRGAEGDGGAAAAEPAGRRHPPVRPGGRSDVTLIWSVQAETQKILKKD